MATAWPDSSAVVPPPRLPFVGLTVERSRLNISGILAGLRPSEGLGPL